MWISPLISPYRLLPCFICFCVCLMHYFDFYSVFYALFWFLLCNFNFYSSRPELQIRCYHKMMPLPFFFLFYMLFNIKIHQLPYSNTRPELDSVKNFIWHLSRSYFQLCQPYLYLKAGMLYAFSRTAPWV